MQNPVTLGGSIVVTMWVPFIIIEILNSKKPPCFFIRLVNLATEVVVVNSETFIGKDKGSNKIAIKHLRSTTKQHVATKSPVFPITKMLATHLAAYTRKYDTSKRLLFLLKRHANLAVIAVVMSLDSYIGKDKGSKKITTKHFLFTTKLAELYTHINVAIYLSENVVKKGRSMTA